MTAVTEQAAEALDVGWRRDEQDVPDARQHERRQRVIDHRLVVDREELLGDDERQRMQAGSGPAGEKYPFHRVRVYLWFVPPSAPKMLETLPTPPSVTEKWKRESCGT